MTLREAIHEMVRFARADGTWREGGDTAATWARMDEWHDREAFSGGIFVLADEIIGSLARHSAPADGRVLVAAGIVLQAARYERSEWDSDINAVWPSL